jgi:hypothetical protein
MLLVTWHCTLISTACTGVRQFRLQREFYSAVASGRLITAGIVLHGLILRENDAVLLVPCSGWVFGRVLRLTDTEERELLHRKNLLDRPFYMIICQKRRMRYTLKTQ